MTPRPVGRGMGTVRRLAALFVATNVAFLLLSVLAFLALRRGTASYVITQVTAAILLCNVAGGLAVLYGGWDPLGTD